LAATSINQLIQNKIAKQLFCNAATKGRLYILSLASTSNGAVIIKYRPKNINRFLGTIDIDRRLIFKLGDDWSSVEYCYEIGFGFGFKSDGFDPYKLEVSLNNLIDILENHHMEWSEFVIATKEFYNGHQPNWIR